MDGRIQNKLQMIKLIRQVSTLGLREAKDFVESNSLETCLDFISSGISPRMSTDSMLAEIESLRDQNVKLESKLRMALAQLPRDIIIDMLIK